MGAWGARERRTGRLCAVVTGLFAGHCLVALQIILHRAQYPFGDFFALWTYAKLAAAGRAADLYDAAAMFKAQLALGLPTGQALGLTPAAEMPFPYPPVFALMLFPLGWLSYQVAAAVWIGVTLALYLYVIGRGARPAWLMVMWAVAAPTTAIGISFGQSGFLLAALLIGGAMLMGRRPLCAGVLLGLLIYKPQFGLLVPVALVACGQWRCVAAASATVAALVASASLAFGSAIWGIWLRSLPAYAAWFETHTKYEAFRISVRDNLQMLGCPPGLAMLAQLAAIVAAAVMVWVAFRRLPRKLAIAVLVAGTCLASPHGMVYDLPMLTGAILLFIDQRMKDGGRFAPAEIGVLLLTAVFPAVMAWGVPLPIGSAVLIMFVSVVFVGRREKSFGVVASQHGAGGFVVVMAGQA